MTEVRPIARPSSRSDYGHGHLSLRKCSPGVGGGVPCCLTGGSLLHTGVLFGTAGGAGVTFKNSLGGEAVRLRTPLLQATTDPILWVLDCLGRGRPSRPLRRRPAKIIAISGKSGPADGDVVSPERGQIIFMLLFHNNTPCPYDCVIASLPCSYCGTLTPMFVWLHHASAAVLSRS